MGFVYFVQIFLIKWSFDKLELTGEVHTVFLFELSTRVNDACIESSMFISER